jgi:predicted metal-binding membrane protein
MWPRVRDQRPFVAALAGLIALSWLSLWSFGRSPYGQLVHAHGGSHGLGTVYVSIAGWTLMIVAMMLPTTLPLVVLFHSFVRTRATRIRLTSALVAGYLWVWTLFGLVAFAGNHVVRGLVDQIGWLEVNAWALAAGVLGAAGVYQFSGLKHKCLEKCRSPLSFIMEHWHGEREEQNAFHLGIRHGVFCIGCCWSLMLLMFLVSSGNLTWMLVLASVMAAEKNLPWGRLLTAPLGALLIGSAGVLVATAWM